MLILGNKIQFTLYHLSLMYITGKRKKQKWHVSHCHRIRHNLKKNTWISIITITHFLGEIYHNHTFLS